jgi:hypothetical protein
MSSSRAISIRTSPYELTVPIKLLFRFLRDRYFFRTITSGLRKGWLPICYFTYSAALLVWTSDTSRPSASFDLGRAKSLKMMSILNYLIVSERSELELRVLASLSVSISSLITGTDAVPITRLLTIQSIGYKRRLSCSMAPTIRSRGFWLDAIFSADITP